MGKSKKILSLLIAYIILIMMPVSVFVVEGASTEKTIYVSENGSDSGNGSANAPYKTFDRALVAAQDGDTIQISGNVKVNKPSNGMDDPLIISKKVTIQGGELYLQTGGIILGNDVTFKDIQINFGSSVRNAIMANGYTLTLNNVTKSTSSPYSIHVFGGSITDYNGGELIPQVSNHGKIIISGKSQLGHIFAGSLTDVANFGGSNEYVGNATIVIEQGTSGSIGNIYAHGASESRGEGDGDLLYPSSEFYTVIGDVDIILNQGKFVKSIDGMTSMFSDGQQAWASVTYNFPNTSGYEAIQLDNLSELRIMAGHLAPKASSMYGITFTEVTVAGGAQLDLSELSNSVTIASFAGSTDTSNPAFLGLKSNQKVTIEHPTDTTKSVTGTTAVGIGGINGGNASWGPIVEKQVYITATNSSNDSFRLLPAGGNTNQILSRDSNGAWTVATGFDVTVNSGIGSGKYKAGDTVIITADSIVGKQFKEWTVVSGGVTLASTTNGTTTFEMPAGNVEITAVYEAIPVPKHRVTVTNGTGSGEYEAGNVVTITANAPESGKQFKGWTVVSGGVTLASTTNGTTTFEMPAGNVEVTAVYEAIPVPKYNVTVANGTGNGEYEAGNVVTITANAPESGKQFKEWTVVSGGVTLASTTDHTTTFEMLVGNVEVTAVYEAIPVPKHRVTVTNGTGSGEYEAGNVVTITANTPESGKQFKEWTVISGGVTLVSTTNHTTSFTMPAVNVEITATYQQTIPVTPTNSPVETEPVTPTNPPVGTEPVTPTNPPVETVPVVPTVPSEENKVNEVVGITSKIVFLSKEFGKLAERLLELTKTLGDIAEQYLSPEALERVKEIETKYEKMKNLSFDQTTPWEETPPVISPRKSWQIKLSQAMKNTEDNLRFIKVVDMFGDPIDVSIKVEGQKIIVTPNADYVADIPYTLVIAPGLESEQGAKLQQGTHLTFTFK